MGDCGHDASARKPKDLQVVKSENRRWEQTETGKSKLPNLLAQPYLLAISSKTLSRH
jgi:hypothetical protein